MKAIFHYDAGPALEASVASLAVDGFEITSCRGADDSRLFAPLPEAEVLLHVQKPATASNAALPAGARPADEADLAPCGTSGFLTTYTGSRSWCATRRCAD